jgi:hypothetical protein
MSKVEITIEQNNSSNHIQSSDCISIPLGNESASILGSYPTANSKVSSQDSDDMHNSKISASDDHQEDSTSNGINELTSHLDSSIDMAEQQGSFSVSANKIDGQVFDDASRYVAEWDDADSVSFICSSLNPVVQNNRQNKIRHTFDIFDRDEIFDILILEKRIKIHAHHVISSSKELGKCAYYKWHDSFSHNSCNCNVFR